MPRCSIHSPRNFSDVSSWLHTVVNAQAVIVQGECLLAVCGVNEVATSFEERVQELETGVLVHGAKPEIAPLVTDGHGT